MIFGDKNKFAIQAMIEPYLNPPSHVWGRMNIVISGFEYGDYMEEHCGLYACVRHLKKLAKE